MTDAEWDEVERRVSIIQARRHRLTMMGMGSEEIEEMCNLDRYPGTLEDEQQQLAAYNQAEAISRNKWHA